MKMTKSINFKENLYMMFYRWYLSSEMLSRMYKGMSSKCWKRKIKEDSFYHLWWTCDLPKYYWEMIHEWLHKMLKLTIPFKSELFLLNISPDNLAKKEKPIIVHSSKNIVCKAL